MNNNIDLHRMDLTMTNIIQNSFKQDHRSTRFYFGQAKIEKNNFL